MEDLSGIDVKPYHLVEKIGQGGMSVVYKVFDIYLESDVVVKIIRREVSSPLVLERVIKRFEREAKALTKLTHPNIVPVIDYGEFKGTPFLVMPYLSGGTLIHHLGKPMNWQQAVRLVLLIARALRFTHSMGILHRDVKLSNILITPSSEPVLADFGIAKFLKYYDEMQTLSATEFGIDTPEYMAPERWMGNASDLSDLYSLGIVFYELVTGHKPYTADTPAAVLLKQSTDLLPRTVSFVPDLPEEVEKVLYKPLAKNPENHYQSMNEFVASLEDPLQRGRVTGSMSKQSLRR